MNKKILSTVKYVALLGIAALLLWFALKGIDIEKTWQEAKHANLFWMSLCVLVSLIAFVSRAIRWNMLIEPLGYKPKLDNTSAALMIGYLANLAFPRLGEVTRCGTLNRTEKIPFDSLFGTVLIERVIDVLSLIICIAITGIVEYDRLLGFLNENVINPLSLKVQVYLGSSIFIFLAITIPLLIIVFILVSRKKKHGYLAKVSNAFKGMISGLATVRKLKSPAWFIFHSVLIWVMYYFMSYTCLKSLDSTTNLGWQAGFLILVGGGIGMSAPVPGGVGAYEYVVIQILILYGIDKDHGGATFALLMHSSQILIVILLGVFSIFYLGKKKKNAATANAQHDTQKNSHG